MNYKPAEVVLISVTMAYSGLTIDFQTSEAPKAPLTALSNPYTPEPPPAKDTERLGRLIVTLSTSTSPVGYDFTNALSGLRR